ncbi:hypothetical protein K491DRAFT_64988 [Lophiostoma macrostomum CBS 122681]|uniref:WSC domain-containing protein n=1 Tax=Lophiostoma macrostomum CBS 122681 TaxID=1314788 RepID=A0A6A6SWS4_9PLEO|nr:hypothetical protein K491DRAFT_64988 [Lophiostoma macrostomum CBS 122681]
MALLNRTAWSCVVAILALFILHFQPTSAQVATTPQLYCSDQNTGSDAGIVSQWEFQSQGNCKGNCTGSAFAIVQWDKCWCSNYIPQEQTDVSNCNGNCPGFPDDKCGNKDDGLFGYYALSHKPSGTQGTSNPSSTPQASPSSVVEVTTINGVVSTKIIIYTPTTTPAPPTERKGTPVGAIAGGVVGGVLGIAAIVAGVLFLLRRHRTQQQQQGEGFQSGVTRNTSTMSKSGLLRTEKATPYPPAVLTGSHRTSRMNMDSDSISPVSGSDRRNSRPYMFDQRMNPSAIMIMDNNSRGSFVSMDDARDYGRTLNVRNPDPDPR